MEFISRICYIPLLGFLFLVMFSGCQNDNPAGAEEAHVENAALVLIVENNNWLGDPALDAGFELFRDQITGIFSDLFGIPAAAMDSMTLTEIIDVYGEAWQIEEITSVAERKYQTVISLTDETATFTRFLNEVSGLNADGYSVDVLFNLHSSGASVWFYDGTCGIDSMISGLGSRNAAIRALYQTCCYGSEMIDNWAGYGITAVNGSVRDNSMVMFSPVYFLEAWTGGVTYSSAVQTAYDREIEMLVSYQEKASVLSLLITDEILEDSKQLLGGSDTTLLWTDFPVSF